MGGFYLIGAKYVIKNNPPPKEYEGCTCSCRGLVAKIDLRTEQLLVQNRKRVLDYKGFPTWLRMSMERTHLGLELSYNVVPLSSVDANEKKMMKRLAIPLHKGPKNVKMVPCGSCWECIKKFFTSITRSQKSNYGFLRK